MFERIREYLRKRKDEKRQLYIARYSFDELQFDFIHRNIDHPKFKHQAEFALHPTSDDWDLLADLVDVQSKYLSITAENKAREFFVGLGLKENKDFFVGHYINGELFYFGVLMIQVKDPKWIMMFKLVFQS